MTQSISLPAHLEQRVAKETGRPYFCVIVKLNDNVEKLIFLSDSEAEVVRLSYTSSGQKVKLGTSNSGN